MARTKRPLIGIITKGSKEESPFSVTETSLSAVSCHHQAVRTVPPDWRAVAKASDGIIEAVEHLYHPWAIGVQWHPELSIKDSASQRLFEAFIEATYIRRAGGLVPSQSMEASAR